MVLIESICSSFSVNVKYTGGAGAGGESRDTGNEMPQTSSGVGNGEAYPPPQPTRGSWSVVRFLASHNMHPGYTQQNMSKYLGAQAPSPQD